MGLVYPLPNFSVRPKSTTGPISNGISTGSLISSSDQLPHAGNKRRKPPSPPHPTVTDSDVPNLSPTLRSPGLLSSPGPMPPAPPHRQSNYITHASDTIGTTMTRKDGGYCEPVHELGSPAHGPDRAIPVERGVRQRRDTDSALWHSDHRHGIRTPVSTIGTPENNKSGGPSLGPTSTLTPENLTNNLVSSEVTPTRNPVLNKYDDQSSMDHSDDDEPEADDPNDLSSSEPATDSVTPPLLPFQLNSHTLRIAGSEDGYIYTRVRTPLVHKPTGTVRIHLKCAQARPKGTCLYRKRMDTTDGENWTVGSLGRRSCKHDHEPPRPEKIQSRAVPLSKTTTEQLTQQLQSGTPLVFSSIFGYLTMSWFSFMVR